MKYYKNIETGKVHQVVSEKDFFEHNNREKFEESTYNDFVDYTEGAYQVVLIYYSMTENNFDTGDRKIKHFCKEVRFEKAKDFINNLYRLCDGENNYNVSFVVDKNTKEPYNIKWIMGCIGGDEE